MLLRRYLLGTVNRSFLWGVGSVGLAWLIRGQLRNLAVEGAKGLLILGRSAKNIAQSSNASIREVVEEAKQNKAKGKIQALNLSSKELSRLAEEAKDLLHRLGIANEAIAEEQRRQNEGAKQDEPL
jgi:hypothetical protein